MAEKPGDEQRWLCVNVWEWHDCDKTNEIAPKNFVAVRVDIETGSSALGNFDTLWHALGARDQDVERQHKAARYNAVPEDRSVTDGGYQRAAGSVPRSYGYVGQSARRCWDSSQDAENLMKRCPIGCDGPFRTSWRLAPALRSIGHEVSATRTFGAFQLLADRTKQPG